MSLTLGTVTFTLDEAPDSLSIGGEQVVAIRKYPGGQLDIQTMGAFDDPISWDGALMFETALSRMAELNAMRIAAQQVTLQLGSLSVPVVVTRFRATYKNDFLILYHIEVHPTAVMGLGGSTSTSTVLATGGLISDTTEQSIIQSAMTPVELAGAAAPPTYVTSSEFGSSLVAPVGAILNVMSPATAASLGPALSGAAQVMHFVAAGETLWSIAAQYYSSGSQWTQIAAANNIQNAQGLTAGQQLFIPNPTQDPN